MSQPEHVQWILCDTSVALVASIGCSKHATSAARTLSSATTRTRSIRCRKSTISASITGHRPGFPVVDPQGRIDTHLQEQTAATAAQYMETVREILEPATRLERVTC